MPHSNEVILEGRGAASPHGLRCPECKHTWHGLTCQSVKATKYYDDGQGRRRMEQLICKCPPQFKE